MTNLLRIPDKHKIKLAKVAMSDAIEIVKSPWQDLFVSLVRDAKKRIHLASPYIKSVTAKMIINNLPKRKLDVKYISSFKLEDFLRGSSDIEAFRIFDSNYIVVKNIQKLHAKLFIFDETAIITSGNLTRNGMNFNIEYGVMVNGQLVKNIAEDFLDIWKNSECYRINSAILDRAEKIIKISPKRYSGKIRLDERRFFNNAMRDPQTDDLYTGGIESIVENLSAWEKEIFHCVDEIGTGIFKLSQVYSFEVLLQSKFPRNHHIKDKIRQQLQNLRNIGLIEFVKPGIYRKLWSNE